MIFKKLILNNFRQYYGNQEIEFAYESEKNITILFGENGKGKTGIYRAVMFSLFGSMYISQDNKDEKIHITNFKHLNEVFPKPAKSSVTLIFEHEDKKYEIERTVSSIKSPNNNVQERKNSSKLVIIDEYGNTSPDILTEEYYINSEINKILNEEIKDFFLFDAEKIDTLAKSDPKVRKEVKQAIFSMINLDKIEESKSLLNKHINDIKIKLQAKIKDEGLNQKKIELKNKENLHKNLEIIIEERKKNREKLENSISNNKMILDKNEKILEVKNNIKELEIIYNNQKEDLKNISKGIVKEVSRNAPFLLLNDQLLMNKNFYESYLGDKKIKVDLSLLQESLQNNKCMVCNSNLENNEHGKKHIEELLENYTHSDSIEIVRDILYMIDNNTPQFEDKKSEFKKYIKNYHEQENSIQKTLENIRLLNKEIGKQANNDMKLYDIQKMIENDSKDMKSLDEKIIIEKNDYNILKNEINNLHEEIENIEMKNLEDEKIKKTIEILQELKNDLQKVSSDFNKDIRAKLGEITTQNFQKLIDKKDENVIDKVVINTHFEINALNEQGVNINQDISQGQRQVLALSFIAALSKVAVNKLDTNVIDYPLFMDSPFNRLSGNNRDNLITLLPELTSQWILLLTDTELTPSEEIVFKNTGKLGRWYKINQIEPNYSEIEEISTNETMATRGRIINEDY